MICVSDGADFAVPGSNFGRPPHPSWTGNLLAHPDARIDVAGRTPAVRATLADGATWDRLWPSFVEVFPGVADYRTRSGRTPRMFLLRPGG